MIFRLSHTIWGGLSFDHLHRESFASDLCVEHTQRIYDTRIHAYHIGDVDKNESDAVV